MKNRLAGRFAPQTVAFVFLIFAFFALALTTAATVAAIQVESPGLRHRIWQPAAAPPGGVSWEVLEKTKEITRTGSDGYIRSKPVFTQRVKALAGKRIKVSGYMDAFKAGRRQTHFLLLAYPPGCPYHFHAAPNQFIEVKASTAFPLSTSRPIIVSGVLELTGDNESGIFYVLNSAQPG